jgi:hypothetical protein
MQQVPGQMLDAGGASATMFQSAFMEQVAIIQQKRGRQLNFVGRTYPPTGAAL